ncbi:MAG: RsfS/YbeB/iojap family protein [bacterium]
MINKKADQIVDELKKMDVFNITIVNTPEYLTDYFVVGSVDNVVTLRAIVDKFKQEGVLVHGSPDSGWVIFEFDDFWCHIFLPPKREYYSIERLWDLKSTMKGVK